MKKPKLVRGGLAFAAIVLLCLLLPAIRPKAATPYSLIEYYQIYQSEAAGTRYKSGDYYFYTKMLSDGREQLYAAKTLKAKGKLLYTTKAENPHISNLLANDTYVYYAVSNAAGTYYVIYRNTLSGSGTAKKLTAVKCNAAGEVLLWNATGGNLYYTLSAPADGEQRLYACKISTGKNTKKASGLYVEATNGRYLYMSAYADEYMLHVFDCKTGKVIARPKKPEMLMSVEKVFVYDDRIYVVTQYQDNTGAIVRNVFRYKLNGTSRTNVMSTRKDGISIGDVTKTYIYYSEDQGNGTTYYYAYKQSTKKSARVKAANYKDTWGGGQ